MNRFGWLVKRELWENRSIVWGMPITAAILIVASMFGLQGVESLPFDDRFDADKQRAIVAAIYFGVATLFFVWAFFQVFFYSLDALYADRRDRSVLFWKSLPLSDAETVGAKAFTALVAVPLWAAASAVVAQWGVALVASARVGSAVMLDPVALAIGAGSALYLALLFAMWYAPLVAYLLAWSAWAPKSPFLYAVLPPAMLAFGEELLFDTHYVGSLIRSRLIGVVEKGLGADRDGVFFGVEMRGDDVRVGGPERLGDLAGGFFGEPALWLGLAAAVALYYAAVKIRRYRDEAT